MRLLPAPFPLAYSLIAWSFVAKNKRKTAHPMAGGQSVTTNRRPDLLAISLRVDDIAAPVLPARPLPSRDASATAPVLVRPSPPPRFARCRHSCLHRSTGTAPAAPGDRDQHRLPA